MLSDIGFVGLLVGWSIKYIKRFAMKKIDRFAVTVHVAPFVKKYLLTNFGVYDEMWPDLVNISSDRQLSGVFRSMLVKKHYEFDRRIEAQANRFRSERINIEISKSDFYKYGWAISLTDEIRFSSVLEARCKTMLITYLSSAYLVTPCLASCIRQFYHLFGFDDETWPIDSIRKIWLRDKTIDKQALKMGIFQKINEIIILQMSVNGTIAEQGKLAYENNNCST